MHAETTGDATTVALNALIWTIGDAARSDRLLAVTGLSPADLRSRAADPAVLAAVLGFLEAHEPDLVACADVLDVAPAALVQARATLEAA